MGSILKRWRREESAEEVLASLEQQVRKLESMQQKNEQFYQRFIGRLMFYSILLYITAALVFYLYYFPKQWKQRILKSIPLLVFPFLIYGVRRILHYFFNTRKRKNAIKLEELRSRKQKVIEDVKEKETYKKAKEILEKFDPDSSVLKNDIKQEASDRSVTLATPGTEIRQRNAGKVSSTPNSSFSRHPPPVSATPMRPVVSPLSGMSPSIQRQFFLNNVPPGTPPGPPKPIPVKPKKRTITDKFVDYLVGDGPNSRYALICKVCHCHNGMALREDFEFTTFRCCYCYHLNEARKQRPSAPPLPKLATPASSKENSYSTVDKKSEREETEQEKSKDDASKNVSTAEEHMPALAEDNKQ